MTAGQGGRGSAAACPPRLLLASEMGAGRGHVTSLAAVARALGPGLPLLAALPSLRHAGTLAALGARVLQAPALRYAPEARANPALEGNASWGDYLAACGLAREAAVRRGLAFWRKLIVDEDISLLVADYAPLALRAAQGLQAEGWQIVTVATGTGYGLPPHELDRFPQLLADQDRVIHPEPEVLALLNRIGTEQGLAPLPRLPALYAADHVVPRSFAFLDPYAALRPPGSLLPPETGGRVPEAVGGTAVFAYFSTQELADPEVADALAALPLPRFGYLPGAAPEVLARLAASGMEISPTPLHPAEIAARARLVLSAGQHGTLSMAALAGLPQVALPQHLEQLFHARRAETAGIARLLWRPERRAGAIVELVLAACSDPAIADAARALGAVLRAEVGPDPEAKLARRLAPALPAARAASLSGG
ncbi:MAG: hypothetical protein Q8J98_06410 [Phaeovulum sp.]|uniref:glycosyltransferase n=1 Tax=Phaeovulum sp. TaxID=2934796 RepID=UPI0027301388|nr:hypothetical protein [Phaeovulum sp.]MDP2062727.1 hypothetical protein [Phaeovulum sp.]